MARPGLSEELALRIGVAARCLPGLGVAGTVELLVSALGLPLTAEKLARLTSARLRHSGRGVLDGISAAALAQAIAYLKGEAAIRVLDEPAPVLKASPGRPSPHTLRVAVSSDGGEWGDGDFLRCRRYLIYEVSSEDARLIDVRENPPGGNRHVRKTACVGRIADCHMVYALSLSTPVSAALMAAGIHPVHLPDPQGAPEILSSLQAILGHRPPPWLAKAAGLPLRPRLHAAREVFSLCS